ncbi:DUF2293 domain-containing protein [Fuerstiella marisgermanici]|uniref:DUF2293 domain-containing protein n=1 Tax=Fuerstiella marisgermanici TaxID=1891926 RepID=A0A1P8WQD2_9PLAN|nr:DUF2293 domain-containing protein [Fuerstiella marisgermanici]APZ96265.1 hypothetical protein Fuma_05933 [Fuerstiella marisgermanici]
MKPKSLDVSPGIRERTVIFSGGRIEEVPADWELLPPGDAGLTRRVKAAGPSWTVKEQKGRKTFSRGVYADASTIARIREELDAERSTDAYTKRRAADAKRREKKQDEYVDTFRDAVLHFLNFAPRYHDIADKMATAITEHATPVGSGTVARTQRIPVEQRAESAVIAWMRHQTTAYDHMKIPRERGKRREVRRMLAQQSRQVLNAYRSGEDVGLGCPLQKAIM